VATKRREDPDSIVITEQKTEKKLARPRLYKVILINDDFTTMEFVVALLVHVFHHSETSAQAIMLNIHRTGAGIAGIYTKEIAETKVAQVMELAEKAEYPLQCTMEPDDDDPDSKE
jgi:ATP-dependent Clp protease adaptor protein ClpS